MKKLILFIALLLSVGAFAQQQIISTKVLKISEKIDMQGKPIVNLPLPVLPEHPATKSYVDSKTFTQVQADWNQTTTTAADFIKNKPAVNNFVPYTGAAKNVDLDTYNITASKASFGFEETVPNKGKFLNLIYPKNHNYPVFKYQTYYYFNGNFYNTSGIGIGSSALQNNTGGNCYGFGDEALQNNTGDYCNGFGIFALQNNTVNYCNGFGSSALQNNTGNYCNGVGYYALQNNTGGTCNGFGVFALQNNTGNYCNGFGYYALQNNTGNYCNGFGYSALINNTGNNCTGIGNKALTNNSSDNNTAIGHGAFVGFYENTQAQKTFDYTAIEPATKRISIPNHGFGTPGSWVNVKFLQGTASVPGLANDVVYQIKIINADTVSFYEQINPGKNIYHGTQIYSVGTSTVNKLIPQFAYTNTTCIGATSNPTKSNQVVLGNNAVTEVSTSGNYLSTGAGNGLILKTPDGTKKYKIAIDNNGALTTTPIP